MTTVESAESLERPNRRTGRWMRAEHGLDRASEWLNPILVKEARQALKSRQFQITFCLLLLFGWGWSFLGIALLLPGVRFLPGGRFMLIGYYLVLAIPMLIVVPFAAFRSLAGEREDGTYELVSITALSARQIVTGKLGSAVLQMLVYLSAISPCIAFTYLLRGVDIVVILLVVVYTFLASLLISTLSLFIATISRSRNWQVFLSLILVVLLLLATALWSQLVIFFLIEPPPVSESFFWTLNAAILSVYASYVVLFIYAGAAQISFPSDNRATKLRLIMLVQHMLVVGWMFYVWLVAQAGGWPLYTMLCILAIHWMTMGTLMCGETAQLSPRVRRGLPQSFVGRMFFSCIFPGSGSGYCLAVSGVTVGVLAALLALWTADALAFGGAPSEFEGFWVAFPIMVWCYFTAYLGAGRLLLLFVRQFFAHAGVLVSLLINVLLLAIGALAPFFLQLFATDFAEPAYSELQAFNWLWSMLETVRGDITDYPASIVLAVTAAGIILAVNLGLMIHEAEQLRQAAPQRVVEDDETSDDVKGEVPARPASPFE